MTRTVVTIKATDTVKKLAAKASQIQDACNPHAVARFLIQVQDHFAKDTSETGQQYTGHDIALQNPVSIAVLNKLNHLAGLEQSRSMCFSAIMDLAEGTDVDWSIDFLD